MKSSHTYTYQQMATTLERSERTIGRWLAALRIRYPDEVLTDRKGQITEDGVNRLYQYREEVAAGVSLEDGAEETDLATADNLGSQSVAIPNFEEISEEFRSRLQQMIESDKQFARKIGYNATVEALGTGLYEGRQKAMREVMGQAPLN